MLAPRAARGLEDGGGVQSRPTAMTISGVAAAWIAQLVFWALLLVGAAVRELSTRSIGAFLFLWLVGYAAFPRISWRWGLFTTPYVAVLDIVLVFIVLKGDVQLS
jgi:hypothetical protein